MKAMLLILTLTLIPLSGFAKTKKAKMPVRMKFTPSVYYKLDHKNRLKYLNAFIEVALEADKNLRAEGRSQNLFDLYDLLLPTADASANICLIGGIYFDKPANQTCNSITTVPNDFRFQNLAPHYSCGLEKRCAAYFGVDNNGQGFCHNRPGNETADCHTKSQAGNGVRNLNAKLSNCSANAEFCSAFQTAMAKEQEKLSAYCDARPRSGACRRAKETIAAVTGQASDVAAGTTLDNKTGCSEANLNQMGGDTPDSLARQLNMRNGVDPYWYQMARIATLACDSTQRKNTEDIFKNTGVCEARSAAEAACAAPQREMGRCINAEIERLGQAGFRTAVAEVDRASCSNNGSTITCVQGRNPLEIRNNVEIGRIDGLDKILNKFCPTQAKNFTDCRSRSSGASQETRPDVSTMLRNTVEAEQAVRSLESHQNLTDGQKAGFERFFGISPDEFKSFFCASSPEQFRIKSQQAFFAKGAGDNPVRARMQACAAETVQLSRSMHSGAEIVRSRSNYQDRNCRQHKVTSIRENEVQSGMKNYLYYEKDTGRCYKGAEVVTSVPSSVPAANRPRCNNDNVGVVSTPRYIRLDHAYTGGDVQPRYACLDRDFFSGTNFDIFQVRCQTDDMGGLDIPAVAQ